MNERSYLDWKEIEPAAREMFRVWTDGSETDFAKEAWGHLGAAGLVGNDTLVEETAAQLHLLTLARVYHEFCGLAWEENTGLSLNELSERLKLDLVAVGLLVPKNKVSKMDQASDGYELKESALAEIIDGQKQPLFKCLSAAYGGGEKLYSRLWQTRSSRDSDENDGDEWEVSGPSGEALRYVLNGFQEG